MFACCAACTVTRCCRTGGALYSERAPLFPGSAHRDRACHIGRWKPWKRVFASTRLLNEQISAWCDRSGQIRLVELNTPVDEPYCTDQPATAKTQCCD